MEASTGVEQGEAINAEVAPRRKAWREGGNLSNCMVASKEGSFRFIKSRRFRPITMATTEAVKGNAAPSAPAPAEPKSFPARVAERPRTERDVASPTVNMPARKRRVFWLREGSVPSSVR